MLKSSDTYSLSLPNTDWPHLTPLFSHSVLRIVSKYWMSVHCSFYRKISTFPFLFSPSLHQPSLFIFAFLSSPLLSSLAILSSPLLLSSSLISTLLPFSFFHYIFPSIALNDYVNQDISQVPHTCTTKITMKSGVAAWDMTVSWTIRSTTLPFSFTLSCLN